MSTTDTERVADPAWQIEQLAWHRSHLVTSLAQRIKKRLSDGAQPFETFTHVQVHATAAAASHVDCLVLQAFATDAGRIDDEEIRTVLERLVALHGLGAIASHLGWYQEHGHMSSATARTVRGVREQLVRDIAPNSLGLVDAFGIPESVLAAPIAARTRQTGTGS